MTIYRHFDIESDHEFYCYLKANLPSEYEVLAEPSAKYYSEWDFCYKVVRGEEVVAQFEGSFKTIARGSLVKQAQRLLRELSGTATEQGKGDRC